MNGNVNLDSFSAGSLQNSLQLFIELEKGGVTSIIDARSLLTDKISNEFQSLRKRSVKEKIIKCPSCRSFRCRCMSVNTCDGTRVSGGYKSVTACTDCGHELYSLEACK